VYDEIISAYAQQATKSFQTVLLIDLAKLTYVYKDDISGGFIRLREILLVNSVGQSRRCCLIHKFQHIQPRHPKHKGFR
jgi:hypothetical protein